MELNYKGFTVQTGLHVYMMKIVKRLSMILVSQRLLVKTKTI